MKWRKVEDGYLVKLEMGEEMIGTLTAFAREQKIVGGVISGIGSVKNATIGIFSADLSQYITKVYNDVLEVGNLNGNIAVSLEDDTPFIHCHVTAANEARGTISGHLFGAAVEVTMEIYIRVFSEKIVRLKDEATEYNIWEL